MPESPFTATGAASPPRAAPSLGAGLLSHHPRSAALSGSGLVPAGTLGLACHLPAASSPPGRVPQTLASGGEERGAGPCWNGSLGTSSPARLPLLAHALRSEAFNTGRGLAPSRPQARHECPGSAAPWQRPSPPLELHISGLSSFTSGLAPPQAPASSPTPEMLFLPKLSSPRSE